MAHTLGLGRVATCTLLPRDRRENGSGEGGEHLCTKKRTRPSHGASTMRYGTKETKLRLRSCSQRTSLTTAPSPASRPGAKDTSINSLCFAAPSPTFTSLPRTYSPKGTRSLTDGRGVA